jgi:hypothetical protein
MNLANASPRPGAGGTSPAIVLRIVAGPHEGEEFAFDSYGTLIVGRAADAQWRLAKDPFFSRYHFRVEANPPQCRLEDLQSSNGTEVNGSRVTEIDLRQGDRIECGDTVFEVTVTGAANPVFAATLDLSPEERQAASDKLHSAPLAAAPLFAPKPAHPPRLADFDLQRELGRGGMGVVYHGIQRRTGREAAIKIIHPQTVVPPDALQMFLREASILSQLKHPRIVEYLTVGLHQGQMFLAMEYLPVINFTEALASQPRPRQIRLACGVMCHVLEALAHAHAKEIVHRDVKPQNLLVYRQEGRLRVKLADFGLAKNYLNAGFSSLTRDDDIRGTISYMSPEQILDSRYASPPCDLYSVGVCLYLFLSGKLPFQAKDAHGAIVAILNSVPPPISLRAPDVPADLAAIVDRSLAREPEDRFPSAESMRQALLKFTEK